MQIFLPEQTIFNLVTGAEESDDITMLSRDRHTYLKVGAINPDMHGSAVPLLDSRN